MAKKLFNQTFTLYSTTGEALEFFGEAVTAPTKPTLAVSVGADNRVSFVCANVPAGKDDFAAAASIEYLGPGREHWPSAGMELLAGYLHKGDPLRQQFILMWALDKGKDPDELHFYIFRHASLVSAFIGDDLFGSTGTGQENGAGSGNGPGKP
jgi:hypothetical protein